MAGEGAEAMTSPFLKIKQVLNAFTHMKCLASSLIESDKGRLVARMGGWE